MKRHKLCWIFFLNVNQGRRGKVGQFGGFRGGFEKMKGEV
jgi:hypothetical protein